MDRHASQTLIDYELLTAPTGEKGDLKRVAAFGWYAGGTFCPGFKANGDPPRV